MSLSTIDWGHLKAFSGGDNLLEEELLALFVQHTEAQLLVLHRSWNIRNLKRIAQVAHQLRSSCSTIGAFELYGLMTDLEAYAVLQRETDLEPLINALNFKFAQVANEIYQYSNSPTPLNSSGGIETKAIKSS